MKPAERISGSPAAIELALCVVKGKIGFHVIAVFAHVDNSKNKKQQQKYKTTTKSKRKNKETKNKLLAVDVDSYTPQRLTY